jgi:ubiquinone/menaquinone biosynthesis C-methylase UbiE
MLDVRLARRAREDTMTEATFHAHDYAGTGPENYEKYFVPAIGSPVATDLLVAASLRPGERVLDVACGTGVVTKLAAKAVGASGRVAGLDVNPGMLAVARATTPDAANVEWYETTAEAMPLADASFDVVLCQMGLQFVPDRVRALTEVKRVLAPGGRAVITLPGPTPSPFVAFSDALARQIDPRAAAFVDVVFSLHDPDTLRAMAAEAGFERVSVDRATKLLRLPEPEAFLWQYVHSTPLAGVVRQATAEQRAALAADVLDRWQPFVVDGALTVELGMTTLRANR